MNNKYVKMSGGISQVNPMELNMVFEKILQQVGEYGVGKMQEYTKPHEFRGDLTESMMWKTANAKGGNTNGDTEISEVEVPNSVHMGSANDHALYRERGTGRHVTDDRADEFTANMKEWCRIKLGFEPDQDPRRFSNIMNKIKENGTEAAPFALPSALFIRQEGTRLGTKGITEYWYSRAKKWGKA